MNVFFSKVNVSVKKINVSEGFSFTLFFTEHSLGHVNLEENFEKI